MQGENMRNAVLPALMLRLGVTSLGARVLVHLPVGCLAIYLRT